MEKLENTKPEKLLIAISALGNHGKTLSATRLIELLISHREGWLYDSRSINLKKEQLAILQRNGTAEIAVITIGDGVGRRFEDWYNIVASIPTIKIIVGCCRTKHGTFAYLKKFAMTHQYTMVVTHPYFQEMPVLTKGSPIANYWNTIFANHLLDMIHLHL